MLKAFFVPLKEDTPGYGGHIMFLQTIYGRTDIFKGNTYPEAQPSQSRIGFMEFEPNEESITQWCYNYFKDCAKHPAIYKVNLETMQQELLTDKYIEDFVNDNYDEIVRRLNEKS
jgi:hypothetical protein